jgi:hypothetical protein
MAAAEKNGRPWRLLLATARLLTAPGVCSAVLLASTLGAYSAPPGLCQITISSITPSPINWTGSGGGYNVLDPSSYYQQVAISVSKTHNGDGCTFMIGASIGAGDSYTNRTLIAAGSTTPLNFNLYVDSSGRNILEDPPNARSSNIIVGSFESGHTATHTYYFYFRIPPNQFVPTTSGTLIYSRTVTFHLYKGDIADPTEVSSVAATLNATVPPVMSVSVGTPSFGSPVIFGRVNLNTLDFQSTNTKSIDLYVQANTGFKLALASLNRGVMRYTTNRHDTSAVPYTVTIGGSVLSLSHPKIISGSSAPTGIGGLDLPLTITVPPQSQWDQQPAQLLSAGAYSDVIVVTAIAQ